MTDPRPHRRLSQLEFLWIAGWAAVLIPLFVVAARRVLHFHPVLTPSSVLARLKGRQLTTLVDLGGVGFEQLQAEGSLLNAEGARWRSVSRGAELELMGQRTAWGSFELDVPAFSVVDQDVVIALEPLPVDVLIELTLVERDGDMWHFGTQPLPAGSRELGVALGQLDYQGRSSRPQGLQEITRLYLCVQPALENATGSLVIERIAITPASLPEILVVPAPAIDERGYRNQHPVQAPEGSFRVAMLGDSMVYGSGLKATRGVDQQVFSAQLEALLQPALPGAQVLNFGVPGYNTELEVALYEETVRAYQPDLVMLFWFSNDDEDVRENRRVREQLRSSEKYRQLFSSLQDEDLLRRLITQEAGARSESLRSMELATESMGRLAALAEQDGIPVVLVIFYDTPARQRAALLEISEVQGWPVVELSGLLSRYGPRRIYVQAEQAPYDSHPSLFGHTVIAETLAAFLERAELIPAE